MKIRLLLSVLLIVLSFNCKREINDSKNIQKKNIKQEYTKFKNFPDTVHLNKVYYATMEYASKLDTIKLSTGVTRDIFFYVTTQEGTFESVEEIERAKHEVFGKDETGSIQFRFAFEKLGVNNFKGIIQDMVILENYYENGNARIITRLTEIDKEIFVVDR